MGNIIPRDIAKCWSYVDPDSARVVKACSFPLDDREGRTGQNVTTRDDPFIETTFVKKCNPKRDICDIKIKDTLYKKCDPEKDKKCKITINHLLSMINS